MRFFKNKHFKGVAAIIIITVILAIISCFKSNFIANTLNTLSTPVQSVFAAMIRPISQHFTMLNEMEGYKSENERLIKEITKLKIENRDTKSYVEENNRLKKLLDLRDKETDMETVAANVISRDYEKWFKGITVNKGSLSGIEIGDPVMTTDGILGVVDSVGPNWAKVKTIYDSKSAVGAKFTRTGDIGVVEGSQEFADQERCRVQYISGAAPVVVGDILVTSGLGEIYPSGLMIGKIDEIKTDAMGNIEYVAVKPAVDFGSVYEVLVITDFVEEVIEDEEEKDEEESDEEDESEEESEDGEPEIDEDDE